MSRLDVRRHAPEAYQAVVALDGCVGRRLHPEVYELVKLHASQLNGCAFCVDMHATSLERAGVPTRTIYAVAAWREAPFFTPEQRAALALTEAVTRLDRGVDQAVWEEAARAFPEDTLAHLVLAIGTINLWNRIGVTTRLEPPAPQH